MLVIAVTMIVKIMIKITMIIIKDTVITIVFITNDDDKSKDNNYDKDSDAL